MSTAVPARVRALLERALATQRLSHALIFAGPEGTGKSETARWLAGALLCQQAGGSGPCGACASCGKVARATHPDVVQVAPDGKFIKIDQVRSIIRALAFKPFEANARVVVIEEAHQLMEQAQNALLKTLEEPPAAGYLLLLTSKPDTLLQTIRSRTQRVDFRPLGLAEIARSLVELDGIEPEQARLRAAESGGSLARARELSVAPLEAATDEALKLLEAATSGRRAAQGVGAIIAAGQAFAQSPELTAALLGSLKAILRDAAVLALTDRDDLALSTATAERARAVGRRLGPQRAWAALADVERAEFDFGHNAARRLVLEALLLRVWRESAPR